MALYRRIFGPGPWAPFGQDSSALLASSAGMTGGSIDGAAAAGLGLDLSSLENPATLAQATGMVSLVNPSAVPSPIAEPPPASLAIPSTSAGLPTWVWILAAGALVWWFYFRKGSPTG